MIVVSGRFAPIAALMMLIIGLGGCVTSECSVFNVHTVEPGVLVRGGQPDEEGLRELQELYDIRTVVNFNDDTAHSQREWVESLGMHYISIPANAFEPRREDFLAFLKVMEHSEELGPVYVHCRHGMDRTGIAVGAWRIVMNGWDAERAVREMQSHRQLYNILSLAHVPGYIRGIERDRKTWERLLAKIEPPLLPRQRVADRGAAPAREATASN